MRRKRKLEFQQKLQLALRGSRATLDGLERISPGAMRIFRERIRQQLEEGYTHAHDAGHQHDELVRAAVVYAIRALGARTMLPVSTEGMWPLTWKFNQGDPIRMLEKAGALIAAELDRRLASGENLTGTAAVKEAIRKARGGEPPSPPEGYA